MTAPVTPPTIESRPPLLTIRGGASDEEVAALVAAVQALATAAAAAASSGTPAPRSEWGAAHRRVRATYPAGPGGWRSSALPR